MAFTNHYYQVLSFIWWNYKEILSLAGIFSCQRIPGKNFLPQNWLFLPRQESRTLFPTLSSQIHYIPQLELCIDESIPFKGRHKYKVYIPSKPIKYGLKAYLLCESRTGYVLNWELNKTKDCRICKLKRKRTQVSYFCSQCNHPVCPTCYDEHWILIKSDLP